MILVAAALWLPGAAQPAGRAGTPRGAVQAFFTLLKAGQYASLHEYLPSKLQQQMSPEQLGRNLKRLETFIRIEKLEIGRVQQKGDYAVVDTTIYGRLTRPVRLDDVEITEGRVSVQQYLFKEGGRWKIATADNRTRDFFLNENPAFKDQFQFSQPKFEFRSGGRWIARDPGKPAK